VHVVCWHKVGHRGAAAEGQLVPRCLLPGVSLDLSRVERLLAWLLACTWAAAVTSCCRQTTLAALTFSHS
jgi:hypothetical protein